MVFQDNEYVPEYLNTRGAGLEYFQLFGEWIMPCVDIDLYEHEIPEYGVNRDIMDVQVRFQHSILGNKN